MTQTEAIEAMNAGYKVKHRFFDDEEYIFIMNGDIIDEKGYRLTHPGFDFWKYRTGPAWLTGWSIV